MQKPYVKLSATLASLGVGLFMLERYGLGELQGLNNGQGLDLDPNLLGLMVIIPFALILAAALVFTVGRMRRM